MSDTLKDRLAAFVRSPNYRPMNKSELARNLEVPSKERPALREAIRELENQGDIIRGKGSRYSPRESSGNVLVGKIRFRPNGHAVLMPDGNDPRNAPGLAKLDGATRLFIPRRHTMTALDGDRVAVKIHHTGIPKWWRHVRAKRELIEELERAGEVRVEGRVVRVLERVGKSFTGTLVQHGHFVGVEPDDPSLPPIVHLGNDDDHDHAEIGETVVARIENWTSRDAPPEGRVLKRLGPRDAPGVDILSIIYRNHLPIEFPPEVVAEAEAIPEEIAAAEAARREDWRERVVITIDPFDARDFDDAIAVTPIDDGGWELAVHIADVSHYVTPGGQLDTEARERGNSVYLVDRVLPMLPEKLSNGLCSLKPGTDRLTRAVIMRFNPRGEIQDTRFTSAIINSNARLSYQQAIAILRDSGAVAGAERTTPDPGTPEPTTVPPETGTSTAAGTDANVDSQALATLLGDAWALASLLRKNRFANGALDLDFAEIKVHLDENGAPVRLERLEYDESHQLIEEFMLAANEAVARATQHSGNPSIYRIHDDPDAGKLFEFTELARAYGFAAGDFSQHGELQKFLVWIKGRPEEHALKLALLKSLKRAEYNVKPLGHFGLAKDHYTHYTSPIRRYADLVVHRILSHITEPRSSPPPPIPKLKNLEEIAAHISETERTAATAEIESRRLKELEFLDMQSRRPDAPPMRAVIYDARHIGLFVELETYLIKGLIHRSVLEDDDLRFDPARQRFSDPRDQNTLTVGDELEVRVTRVDFDRLRVDFAPAHHIPNPSSTPARRISKS